MEIVSRLDEHWLLGGMERKETHLFPDQTGYSIILTGRNLLIFIQSRRRRGRRRAGVVCTGADMKLPTEYCYVCSM
jgi:hypothetical protein